MEFVIPHSGRFAQSPSRSIDTFVLRTLDQLHPEITSKGIALELDLDHVTVPVLHHDLQTAVRGFIVNAIQCVGDHSQLAITLIDSAGFESPGHWELEICDFTSSTGVDQPNSTSRLFPMNQGNQVLDEDFFGPGVGKTNWGTMTQALQAARRCHGSIEAWHCPQGGIAMILVIPRQRVAQIA